MDQDILCQKAFKQIKSSEKWLLSDDNNSDLM